MDPIDRIKLQTAISKLQQKAHKEDAVLLLLVQAGEAYKQRNWAAAQEKYEKAVNSFKPPMPVVQMLVVAGKAKSRAEARRQIQGGAVHVDGVKLRHAGASVTSRNIVSFRGEELN
tara:strand:+ start:1762 stop:2109 length:348 start_codon:yes stop_codon:yes gene_type:complete